jgi:bacteriocin-like protein
MSTIFKGLELSNYELLSEDEMESISGGNESIHPYCRPPGTICGSEGGSNYTCSIEGESEAKECCCGNSNYNWRCVE